VPRRRHRLEPGTQAAPAASARGIVRRGRRVLHAGPALGGVRRRRGRRDVERGDRVQPTDHHPLPPQPPQPYQRFLPTHAGRRRSSCNRGASSARSSCATLPTHSAADPFLRRLRLGYDQANGLATLQPTSSSSSTAAAAAAAKMHQRNPKTSAATTGAIRCTIINAPVSQTRANRGAKCRCAESTRHGGEQGQ